MLQVSVTDLVDRVPAPPDGKTECERWRSGVVADHSGAQQRAIPVIGYLDSSPVDAAGTDVPDRE